GTVLSFEMGLLWPGLIGRFGGVFGLPFAVEGIFFFAEAIFIAIYIYGWERLSPRAHLWSGAPIVLSGIGGSASVIAANAWMNTPQGFRLASDGSVVDVHPLDAFFTPAFGYEFAHMLLAAYMIAGFMVASVYAMGMLRGRRDRYHRLGFLIPFVVAAIATPLQIVAGDFAARGIYQDQPIKFAAQELVTRTSTHVPETLGGVLIDGEVRYGIKIPSLASILAGFGPGTRITGLESAPRIDRPPANLVHLAFDVMVAVGFLLLALVPARGHAGRSGLGPCARGGLDRDGSRTAALDRLRGHAYERGRDHLTGDLGLVHGGRGRVRGAGDHGGPRVARHVGPVAEG